MPYIVILLRSPPPYKPHSRFGQSFHLSNIHGKTISTHFPRPYTTTYPSWCSQRCHRCKSFAHPVSLQDSELPHFSVAVPRPSFMPSLSTPTYLGSISMPFRLAPVSQFAITCRDCLCTSLGVVEGEGFEPPAHPRLFGDHR